MSLLRPLVVLACLILLAAGCSTTDGTGDKGYVSGSGLPVEVAPADRTDPIELSGEDLDGSPISLSDFRGKPAVVVVWGSWCPPCRAEAPWTAEVAREYDGRAAFVGINIRDASPDNGHAFERTFGIDYPSFYSPDGVALLSFPGVLGPNSIPSVVILDAEGRVAASVIGPLPSKLTLEELVGSVVAEGSGG